MSDPWRAKHFGVGYSAEWLPCGQRTFRILRESGKVKVFPTAREALKAAKERFLKSLEPEIRATLAADPDRMAEKMQAEAEAWLKSSRQDKQDATTIRKPGRKHVIVMRGRV
ncbi:MAG: hypothetical protein M9895_00180 [Aquamicrobium sp.]|uniref:hypothetical protein n=1 Tax=Aquamicrobium sp. TaxID=1872579 RepID=UPI00349EFC82|nr:hypothetical protein [Aquamicrobium sp.]